MPRRVDRRGEELPSLAMVLTGGVGVLAVVAFVAALAFGARAAEARPGARLGIATADGPAGLAVLVPRCQGERVVSVGMGDAAGRPLWRVSAPKGALAERYVVGAETPPFASVTDIGLRAPLPPGPLTATASLSDDGAGTADRVLFDPGAVPVDGVLYQGAVIGPAEFEAQVAGAADCGGSGRSIGLVTWAFLAAALSVVVTYLMMVMRYIDGRSPSG